MLHRLPWLALLCLPAAMAAMAADKPSTAGPTVKVLHPALEMPGLERSRTLRLYLPPGYEQGTRRYPVIYMHDGQNLFDDATAYAGEWGVDEALHDLAARTGFEAIVVGIDNGGEKRMNELSPWPNAKHGAAEGEQYLRFVTEGQALRRPRVANAPGRCIDRDHRQLNGRACVALRDPRAPRRIRDGRRAVALAVVFARRFRLRRAAAAARLRAGLRVCRRTRG